MYIRIFTTIVLLVHLGLIIPINAAAESPNDILIIANKRVGINTISIEETKQIFLRTKTTWRGGDRILCLNQKENDPIRKVFQEKVLGMSEREEATYWEVQKVRKQLTPPPEVPSIPKAVFKLRNAISYAYRKDVPANVVKILLVIPE